jgi:hypothetical protein
MPLNVAGFNAFYIDFIAGYLSIILKIRAAADFPYDIFWMQGVS